MQNASWYDPESFYTAIVKLAVPTEDKATSFTYNNIKGSQLSEFKRKAMVEGFVYVLPATGTIELISPLKVAQILITEQREGEIKK